MEIKKGPEIVIRSESMGELLSSPPSWIVRSGNGLFFIIFLILLSLAWFIEYPDEITGDVIITTEKAPIELSNQGYVQLKSLDVKENQIVKKGDLIAQFDIQASSEDIKDVSNYLNKINYSQGEFKTLPVYSKKVHLGTFQESWTKLDAKIIDWNNELKSDASQQQIASIQREINLRNQLQSINENRLNISSEEFETIRKELESSERLAEQNAISKQTLATDKRTHSQALQTIQSQKEQKVQNLIALNSLKNDLTKLKNDTWLARQQKITDILVSITSFQTSLSNWEKGSIWLAPCSGKIVFNKLLQQNRFYKANEASIVVVPTSSFYNGIATIKVNGAGKIKKDQKVFIELTDYPKSEFGTLEGSVIAKTQIDKGGKYEVKISLPKQLKTTYNKQIPFKAQFKGKVKIVTKNKRVLSRIFEQLMNLVK
ncbi:biotin/lipoyl-binding protein [Fluviicola chungangensis]|uniref:HlyD family efflux transporter periplasmic adaptor subunit n=1 Tax=Fluviicola chungangensis TaxID=2597671 RepID=A0A556MN82_9FLAO|nr:HlyD family efflux transporter periplasmic adaptor subunit [Fluviicola chungangensis]TSJ41292.1 HlyD family efflux transporter periplasmic adaptor subunit [Fluviicola chungangensis]